MIRKIHQGFFKGKRIIANRISFHATRLLANCVIAYNATLLSSLYEKMIAEGAPESVIEQFIRISPIAWGYIIFTSRYNFRKNNGQVDLKRVLNTLEAQLRTTLWTKE